MRLWHCTIVIAAVVVSMLIQTESAAQLYVHDWETGFIHSYDDTTGEIVNPSTPFFRVRGMSLDEEARLILAGGMEQGQVLRFDPELQTFVVLEDPGWFPLAMDAYPDASPDIYAIRNQDPSSGGEFHPALVVLYGGMGPAQTAIEFPFVSFLVDAQVYPLGDRAGNILVLSAHHAFLAEVVRTGPDSFERIEDVLEEIPGHPTSFAINPDGEIVLLDRFEGMFKVVDGGLEPFGSAMGPGLEKISIGSDGTIYVTNWAEGVVLRFNPDGSPLLPSLVGPTLPGAVVAASFTPTPPGGGVPTNPLPDVEVVFEEILYGGYTVGSVVTTQERVSPQGNYLPDYAVEPGGREEGFSYIALESGAVYRNLIQIDVYKDGTRMFYAHGTGDTFRDVTVEGSYDDARGNIGRFSEVVLVEDTRELEAVIDSKFGRLFEGLNIAGQATFGMPCVVDPIRYLKRAAAQAQSFYQLGQIDDALARLADLNDYVRGFAGVCIPDTPEYPDGNVSGDLLAISKTLMFSLELVQPQYRAVPETPSEFAVSVEYPARGQCRITLAGPSGVKVSARVFDVSGRLVHTLFDGEIQGGARSLIWNGKDSTGRRVASGVYFARVEADDGLVTKKLVLVR